MDGVIRFGVVNGIVAVALFVDEYICFAAVDDISAFAALKRVIQPTTAVDADNVRTCAAVQRSLMVANFNRIVAVSAVNRRAPVIITTVRSQNVRPDRIVACARLDCHVVAAILDSVVALVAVDLHVDARTVDFVR